jgi:hypothetical protein
MGNRTGSIRQAERAGVGSDDTATQNATAYSRSRSSVRTIQPASAATLNWPGVPPMMFL